MPQLQVLVDRTKAETLQVSVSDVFAAMSSYLGSTYVNQFNKFGRTFQVYVQADAKFRLKPSDIESLYVKSKTGKMVPLGALVTVNFDAGPSLVTLYNLYPAATVVGGPAPGFQLRPGHGSDGAGGGQYRARRHGLRMDGHVLSGKDRRPSDLLRLRARLAAGLSLPRRPV